MSVHAPGRVVLGGIPRAARLGLGRALARALPSSAPQGGARRSITAGLSMTSMIDVLVVMTVFLLLTFSASDHSHTRDLSGVPTALNITELVDQPPCVVADRVGGNAHGHTEQLGETGADRGERELGVG